MNATQAAQHIAECRRLLQNADAQDRPTIQDETAAYAIGYLILAIDQLAEIVEDLASREQGKVIA
jgi:hypothetical protein